MAIGDCGAPAVKKLLTSGDCGGDPRDMFEAKDNSKSISTEKLSSREYRGR